MVEIEADLFFKVVGLSIFFIGVGLGFILGYKK